MTENNLKNDFEAVCCSRSNKGVCDNCKLRDKISWEWNTDGTRLLFIGCAHKLYEIVKSADPRLKEANKTSEQESFDFYFGKKDSGFPRLKEFTIDYSTRMHNWKVFDAESVRVRERAVADCLTLSLHNLKCLRPNLVIAFKKWYSKQLYGFDIDSESTSKGTNQLAMQQIWNESRDAFLAHELTQVSTSEPEPKEKEEALKR